MNWKLLMAVGVLGLAGGVQGGTNDALQFELKLIEVRGVMGGTGETGRVTADVVELHGEGERRVMVMKNQFHLKLGSLEVTTDGNKVLWDGKEEFPPQSDVLSAPKVTVLPGKKAGIQVQAPVQYMERQSDGRFALREELVGVTAQVMGNLTDKNDEVDVDFHLLETAQAGRASITGVELPIGRPLLERREINTKLRVQLEEWTIAGGVLSRNGPESSVLVVLVRVTTVPPTK